MSGLETEGRGRRGKRKEERGKRRGREGKGKDKKLDQKGKRENTWAQMLLDTADQSTSCTTR